MKGQSSGWDGRSENANDGDARLIASELCTLSVLCTFVEAYTNELYMYTFNGT